MTTVCVLIAVSAADAARGAASGWNQATIAGPAKPRLVIKPKAVAYGDRLTFVGRGFRPNLKVWLGVGPPQSEARYWGSTRADRSGAFRKTLTVKRRLNRGRWIALACQLGFRVKAGAAFRVIAAHR